MLDPNYVKDVLRRLRLEERFITEQTASCVIALYERKGERLRIHDIIEFMRKSLGKTVAENTRESIRKSSMKRLVSHGLVIINEDNPARPVNSGLTNYKLTDDFRNILQVEDSTRRERMINQWLSSHVAVIPEIAESRNEVKIQFRDGSIKRLSPGAHNQLVKSIVEIFLVRYITDPEVVYIGDARKKLFYVNHELVNKLGLVLDEHDKLPDVMVWSSKRNALYVIESVTSGGVVEESRKEEINYIINEKPKRTLIHRGRPVLQIGFITAFPNRRTFTKFANVIAWGTDVWIASEPAGVIRYQYKGKTIYIEI